MTINTPSPLFEQPSIQYPGTAPATPLQTAPVHGAPTESRTLEHIFGTRASDGVAPSSPQPEYTNAVQADAQQTGWTNFLKYGAIYTSLFFVPVLAAFGVVSVRNTQGISFLQASSENLLNPLAEYSQDDRSAQTLPDQDVIASSTSPSYTLTNTKPTQTSSYSYELSLAQGFLQKAVQLSNANQPQSEEDKAQIVEYLNQALLASNRAVQLDPLDHRAFTIRARIYKATSVMKPENAALADADLAKAKELGAPDTSIQNEAPALEQLPTQTAQSPIQALIAAPESSASAETSSTISSNSTSGKATIYKDLEAVFVSAPQTKADSTITAEILGEAYNLQTYIKNKRDQEGFTIGLTGPAPKDIQISWTIVTK